MRSEANFHFRGPRL